jgi:hypothetical protein
MSYKNFKRCICDTYGVELVGWPEQFEFSNPSNLGNEKLKKLLALLQTNACRFEKRSPDEAK